MWLLNYILSIFSYDNNLYYFAYYTYVYYLRDSIIDSITVIAVHGIWIKLDFEIVYEALSQNCDYNISIEK